MRKKIPYIFSVLTLLVLWEILAQIINFPSIFPDVFHLFKQMGDLFHGQEFWFSIFYTIGRGFFGFLIALLLALFLSGLALFSSFIKAYLHPFIVISRTLPVISLVLIALLWFSSDFLPVFIAFFTMFPVLYQNILNGYENADYKLIEMSEVFGFSYFQIWKHIYLPSSRNLIYSGISTAFGFGWRAVIIGEALSQPLHGIGTGMKQAQSYINVSELIGWTIIAIFISSFFEWVILILKKGNFPAYKIHLHNSAKMNKQTTIKELKINQLIKVYDTKTIQFPELEFLAGHIYCIKSPSGYGKTTLLRLISGILKQDSGDIQPSKIRNIAYSFQDVRLIPWLTVKQNILYIVVHRQYQTQELLNHLDDMLTKLQMNDSIDKYPHELSGGQQQRVGLIRALLLPCELLLLDEPLNGLDTEMKKLCIEIIDGYVTRNKPLVLWATHENIQLISTPVSEIKLF